MSWINRFVGSIRKSKLEERLDDELQFHIEMRTREFIATGMTPEEARHQAARLFGNQLLMKERTRDMDTIGWIETLWQDLRYGVRVLCKNPGFTSVAVLTLALGIGANTAIFSLLDAVVLQALPVHDPGQLVQFSYSDAKQENSWFPYPHFDRLQQRNHSLSGMFAIGGGGRITVGVRGETELANAEFATGAYYTVLGVKPLQGRLFTVGDDRPGNAVAVISYAYWHRRFGGNPSVVGTSVLLNRKPFAVIGVTPPEFFGVSVGDSADLTVPLYMRDQVFPDEITLTEAFGDWLRIVGRLNLGVTRQQAHVELDAIYREYLKELVAIAPPRERVVAEHDARYLHLQLLPAARGFRSNLRSFAGALTILMIIVGVVLLVACTNIATLLLARATSRQKEIAVRLAMGAARPRLIRQLLTESVLLAATGGVVGVLFALWGTRALITMLPPNLVVNPVLDIRALAFTAAVSLATGILFGTAPALRSTLVDLSLAMKEGSRIGGGRPRILDRALVVGELALSLVLLSGAGLFIRTMQNLWNVDAGYKRANVLMFSVDAVLAGYNGPRLAGSFRQLLAKMEAIPGVNSVSLSVVRPIDEERYFVSGIGAIDGRALPPTSPIHSALNIVSPNYFVTMGTPMLLGREFGPQDNESSPKVAIISETLAHTAFPKQNPIGRRLTASLENDREMTIVGVAKNLKYGDLREAPRNVVYIPFFQEDRPRDATFEVRYSGAVSALLGRARHAIQSVDKSLPIFRVKTLDAQARESLSRERLIATLSSFFGFLALALTCIGLYGLIAYAVARRTNEIGIRMALGASRASVLWLALRESMLLVVIGIGIGLPAALATTRLIVSVLFGVSPADPVTFSLTTMLMIAVAGFAAYLPARRASRIHPMAALRYE